MPARICVATDYYDEVYNSHCFYDADQIRALMRYCRSLDSGTVEWVLDDMWALYESYPGGVDLLETAVDAAHAEGMEFCVVYKPFEGGLTTIMLPGDFPDLAGAPVWRDWQGAIPIVRAFNVLHPEMCLQRRPDEQDHGGVIRTIRLLKAEDTAVGLRPEDLSLWVGKVNGRFERYDGPMTLEESSQWRPVFPMGKTCRVLTIDCLSIPAEYQFVELRFASGALGTFHNDYTHMVELADADGRSIPCTPAAVEFSWEKSLAKLRQPFMRQLLRLRLGPEAEALLTNESAAELGRDMRDYLRAPGKTEYRLEERGRIAVAKGKIPYLFNALNPVYPEVRQEWLRVVQFCIDRGVDAVDFRSTNHGRFQEHLAYGFNPPVLAALGELPSGGEVRRALGRAYTQFLREAGELLHRHGRKIGVHLVSPMLRASDEAPPYDEAIDWEWQTWVREIADFAVFRGAMGYREPSLHVVVDRFASACRHAGIPLIYQSNRRIFDHKPDALHLAGDRRQWLLREARYALGHPGISAYQLYETAYFTCLDDDGRFRGSDELAELLHRL